MCTRIKHINILHTDENMHTRAIHYAKIQCELNVRIKELGIIQIIIVMSL